MEQAEKSICVRNAGERLLLTARSSFAIFARSAGHRSCAGAIPACGLPAWPAGAVGAVFRPAFRTAPLGETDREMNGEPRADGEQGATMHACSPDEIRG